MSRCFYEMCVLISRRLDSCAVSDLQVISSWWLTKLHVQEMLVARFFSALVTSRCTISLSAQLFGELKHWGAWEAWLAYILNCKGNSDPLLIVLNCSYEYRGGFLGRYFSVAEVFGDALWAFVQRVTKYCVVLASQFECSLGWISTFKAHCVFFVVVVFYFFFL